MSHTHSTRHTNSVSHDGETALRTRVRVHTQITHRFDHHTPHTRGNPVVVSRQSYGGHSERETPGPIPNPEVKPFSADGTATARSWESRTPPDILCSSPASSEAGLLAFPPSTRDGIANGSGVGRRQERVVVVPAQHQLHALERTSRWRGPADRPRCSIVAVSGAWGPAPGGRRLGAGVWGPARADAMRVWWGSTPGFGPLATCV